MAAANAKDSALVGNNCPTELRDVEVVLQVDLMRYHLINVKEMNVL
jgi:hypothetical protein